LPLMWRIFSHHWFAGLDLNSGHTRRSLHFHMIWRPVALCPDIFLLSEHVSVCITRFLLC